MLIRPDGSPVDTWRENYPYAHRMERKEYEWHKRLQQIELLKLQSWIKETGRRLVITPPPTTPRAKPTTATGADEHTGAGRHCPGPGPRRRKVYA